MSSTTTCQQTPAARSRPMLASPRKRLITISMTLFALTVVGAAVAFSEHLPAGAVRSVAGSDVWGGFMHGSGTATSPPLFTMVLLAIAIVLARSSKKIGVIGVILLAVGGVAFAGGLLTEPITGHSLTHFDLIKTPLIALAVVAAPLTALAAALELRDRARRQIRPLAEEETGRTPEVRRCSSLAAQRAPEDRLAGVGAGFRAPVLDPHHPGRHQVHAREEPRYLVVAAGREPLLHRPARVVLEAVLCLAVKETRPHVGDGEVAAGRHGVHQPGDLSVRVVGLWYRVQDGDQRDGDRLAEVEQ
ncbi:MAG TPA: hypothetical protein VFE26_11375, partial [Trebonia sp.]|nr:hypothetical protein [Trebonia sp.]